MMFTRCGCRGDWLQLQLSCDSSIYDIGFTQYLTNLRLIQAIVSATVAPVIHIEANYIYQRTDMTGHLEFGRDFAVNQNCKKTTILWQPDHKEYGRKGPWDGGCCYASVAHLLYLMSEW